jgi:hypothetical protein
MTDRDPPYETHGAAGEIIAASSSGAELCVPVHGDPVKAASVDFDRSDRCQATDLARAP